MIRTDDKPGPRGARPLTARDYPALDGWLVKYNARKLWRVVVNDRAIEAWQLHGGRGVLVEVHPDGNGWDLWSNDDTIDIDETLEAVERRYGLEVPA